MFPDWLDDAGTLFTILGFSVVGFLSTAWSGVRRARRALNKRRDRTLLGAELPVWEQLISADPTAKGEQSVEHQITATRKDLIELIDSGLARDLGSRLDVRASGTIDLRWRDVVCDSSILLPTAFRDDQGLELRLRGLASATVLQADAHHKPRHQLLVVGPAGSGKSTLCLALENHVRMGHEPQWVLVLGLADFVSVDSAGRRDYGTLEWLVEILQNRIGSVGTSDFRHRIVRGLVEERMWIAVDGIDEIASYLGPVRTESVFASWVFDRAVLLTTRVSYYEATMARNPEFRQFRVLWFKPASDAELENYITRLATHTYGPDEGPRHADAAIELWRTLPRIREITRNPLLLAMYTSVQLTWSEGRIPDTLGVYRQFVRLTFRRETVRGSAVGLSVGQMEHILIELAWALRRTPELRTSGRRLLMEFFYHNPRFADGDVRDQVVRFVELCALLHLHSERNSAQGYYELSFYHASFEDYFVGRRLEDWLFGVTDSGADFFDIIETPEITLFVKEILLNVVQSSPDTRSSVSRRLKAKLEQLVSERAGTPDEARARQLSFSAGQVAYHLGLVGDHTTLDWLEGFTDREESFWVRRAAVIGLAFGGRLDRFHAFIDEMRSEIEANNFELARKNIAVELGFYGDQLFDVLDPTRDLGRPECTRLVARACEELSIPVEASNWRMILFNVLYLAKHRTASLASFDTAFGENLAGFEAATRKLESDPSTAPRPEVREMRQLLDDFACRLALAGRRAR